jgi:Protein of unknown function (DUF2568)
MLVVLKKFNLALRGIMELGIVVALGFWGFHTGRNTFMKIILGIGAPVIVFGFWGLVDFRNAGSKSEFLRLIQELVLSGLASIALYFAGEHALAWFLVLISIAHHILVYSLDETLLKK